MPDWTELYILLQERYAGSNLLLPEVGQNTEPLAAALVEQFVSAPLPRTPGLALVDDWDCLRVCPVLYLHTK